MDPILGQIILFAGNFAPTGWAFCQGQLLPIAQNAALFSLLGTTYGGNGQTTFALPDLRGRTPVGFGQGTGLSNYTLGQMAGLEAVTLSVAQMPQHSHPVTADATNGTVASPSHGNLAQPVTPGRPPVAVDGYTGGTPTAPVTLNPATVQGQGGNQPHPNVPPVLALNYIIALQGIFPSRN